MLFPCRLLYIPSIECLSFSSTIGWQVVLIYLRLIGFFVLEAFGCSQGPQSITRFTGKDGIQLRKSRDPILKSFKTFSTGCAIHNMLRKATLQSGKSLWIINAIITVKRISSHLFVMTALIQMQHGRLCDLFLACFLKNVLAYA